MNTEKCKPQTISDEIIDKFIQSLFSEKGFEETATRLRKMLLEDKKTITEKTVHDALFGEGDT